MTEKQKVVVFVLRCEAIGYKWVFIFKLIIF